MRNKEIEAILVSIEGNQLNFLYEKESLINLIPACIYIDGTTYYNYNRLWDSRWKLPQIYAKQLAWKNL